MTRYILSIWFLFFMSLSVFAQTDTTYQQPSLSLLTTDYYHGVTFLNRTYDYELQNKQRSLKQQSVEILVLGIVAAIGTSVGGALVASDHGWSDWAIYPLQTGIIIAVGAPFCIWSNHLRKRANAIQIDTAYLLPMGKSSELGAALFTTDGQLGYRAIGIGFKTTF